MTSGANPSLLLEAISSLALARGLTAGPIATAVSRPIASVSAIFNGIGCSKIAAWEWVVSAMRGEVFLVPFTPEIGVRLQVPLNTPPSHRLELTAAGVERAYLSAGNRQSVRNREQRIQRLNKDLDEAKAAAERHQDDPEVHQSLLAKIRAIRAEIEEISTTPITYGRPSIATASERAVTKALMVGATPGRWLSPRFEHAAGSILMMKGLRAYEAALVTGAPHIQIKRYLTAANDVHGTYKAVPVLDLLARITNSLGYQIEIVVPTDCFITIQKQEDVAMASSGEHARTVTDYGSGTLSKRSLISPDEAESLLRMGKSLREVAAIAGVSKESVRRLAVMRNIPTQSSSAEVAGKKRAAAFIRKMARSQPT